MNGSRHHLRWKKVCLSRPTRCTQRCLHAFDTCLLQDLLGSSFFSAAVLKHSDLKQLKKTLWSKAMKKERVCFCLQVTVRHWGKSWQGLKQELEEETMEELFWLAHTHSCLAIFLIQPRTYFLHSSWPSYINQHSIPHRHAYRPICSDFQVTLGWVKMAIKTIQDMLIDHSFPLTQYFPS